MPPSHQKYTNSSARNHQMSKSALMDPNDPEAETDFKKAYLKLVEKVYAE